MSEPKQSTSDNFVQSGLPETRNSGHDENPSEATEWQKPALHTLLNLHDFEAVARRLFSAKAYAFYSSAATDLTTHRLNAALYQRIFLRPRILRNIRHVDPRTIMLGQPLSFPLFVSPAAMAGLAHPDGELALARACAAAGIAQVISAHASYTLEEIVAAVSVPGQPTPPLFFQLYVATDRARTEALLRRVAALPAIKALFVTVDAPVAGKREADERAASAGTETSALAAGAAGIVISNHGGRALDTAPPAVLTLLELRRHAPEVFAGLEVFVDGGVRRGTDVVKALALGARAVGLGRPFLYSLAYGQEGAEHVVRIMKDEFETSMKLCGVTSVDQFGPHTVNTRDIDHLVPRDDAELHDNPKPRL